MNVAGSGGCLAIGRRQIESGVKPTTSSELRNYWYCWRRPRRLLQSRPKLARYRQPNALACARGVQEECSSHIVFLSRDCSSLHGAAPCACPVGGPHHGNGQSCTCRVHWLYFLAHARCCTLSRPSGISAPGGVRPGVLPKRRVKSRSRNSDSTSRNCSRVSPTPGLAPNFLHFFFHFLSVYSSWPVCCISRLVSCMSKKPFMSASNLRKMSSNFCSMVGGFHGSGSGSGSSTPNSVW